MATLSYSLSRKTLKKKQGNKSDKQAPELHEVLARFVVGNRINQRAKTNIFAPADYWDQKAQLVTIPNYRLMNDEQRALVESLNDINKRLTSLRAAVMEAFVKAGAGKKDLIAGEDNGKSWLAYTIDCINFPEKYKKKQEVKAWTLADAFDDICDNHAGGIHAQRIKVVKRSLLRYEVYKYEGRHISLDSLTVDDIRDFEAYMRQEDTIVKDNPELLKVCEESRKIEARSENCIIGRMRLLRTVVLYAVKTGRTTNNPFNRYSIPEAVYGTPYLLDLIELQHLYNFDLSSRPALAAQRDIFVFQCLVGCRVSDLLKLTRSNLIDGAIEYVPRKTKDDRPMTVRVPLNSIAAEIIARYEDKDLFRCSVCSGPRLLCSQGKYGKGPHGV